MTYQELSNFIWSIANDELRVLFKNHEYGDVIMPFLVLRRINCVLEPVKDKAYQLFEKYKDDINDLAPIIKGQLGTTFNRIKRFWS